MAGFNNNRIYLSPPDIGSDEWVAVSKALSSNWIAPVGPDLDEFEKEFAQTLEGTNALALNSGTSALHLGLIELGVKAGDEVVTPTLTFAGSVFPVLYLGARPLFIDSELASWNMDPELLATTFESRKRKNLPLPRCTIVVHLYGQTANMKDIKNICTNYEVPILEDAAEALGATNGSTPAGKLGALGIFSFNGNKIITTSSGGMLVSENASLIAHARKLANQAREATSHYEHRELGYNYRLSNLLASIGRSQLRTLAHRVERRRHIFEKYKEGLQDLHGIGFMPEAPWGRHTRWLTCITIDSKRMRTTPRSIRESLEQANIEARPLWKPMHLQPVFSQYETICGNVAQSLYEQGLCLPSGTSMSDSDVDKVIKTIRDAVTS